jgi:O-antigen/teichoic acid export membrane protein
VLAATLIAARALPPVALGLFVGLWAAAVIAGACWDAGVSTVVSREVASGRVDATIALRRALGLRLRLLPVWAGAYAIAVGLLAIKSSPDQLSVICFAALSLAGSGRALLVSVAQARMHFRRASLALVAGRWLAVAFSVVALPRGDETSFRLLVLALLAGEIASILILARPLDRRGVGASRTGSNAIRLRAALPFAANSLLAMAYNRLDVVLLGALATGVQLSRYAPASRLQDALYLLPASLSAVALPFMSRAARTQSKVESARLARKLCILGLAFSIPLSLVVTLFARQILDVVLGVGYGGAAGPTRLLVWFLPLASVAAPLIGGLIAWGYHVETTRIFAAAFGTALLAHLSLDWWLGATGAAIASLSRDPIALALTLVFAWRAGLIRVGIPPADKTVVASLP